MYYRIRIIQNYLIRIDMLHALAEYVVCRVFQVLDKKLVIPKKETKLVHKLEPRIYACVESVHLPSEGKQPFEVRVCRRRCVKRPVNHRIEHDGDSGAAVEDPHVGDHQLGDHQSGSCVQTGIGGQVLPENSVATVAGSMSTASDKNTTQDNSLQCQSSSHGAEENLSSTVDLKSSSTVRTTGDDELTCAGSTPPDDDLPGNTRHEVFVGGKSSGESSDGEKNISVGKTLKPTTREVVALKHQPCSYRVEIAPYHGPHSLLPVVGPYYSVPPQKDPINGQVPRLPPGIGSSSRSSREMIPDNTVSTYQKSNMVVTKLEDYAQPATVVGTHRSATDIAVPLS